MTTLTETAHQTRKIIKYGAISLVVFIIFRSILLSGLRYWRKLHPPPPPPPTVGFGKLPKIEFPESRFKEEKLVYRLETITGGTPNLGEKAKVYFIPTKKLNLLALDRAKAQAMRMGFSGQAQKISETLYRWQKEEVLFVTLEMDIVNNNFTIKKNWQGDQTLLSEKILLTKEQAVVETKNFLTRSGFLTEFLERGKAEVSLLRFVPPNLVPAVSLSETDFIKVNLFSENLDNLPVLSENQKEALVSFLLSGSRDGKKRILEVDYTHFPITKDIFATYPLKTSAQAWEELKRGQGFIANLGENKREITIRKIYLAYFESRFPKNYLQPIYAFEGSNEFVAYVPAISPEWTE